MFQPAVTVTGGRGPLKSISQKILGVGGELYSMERSKNGGIKTFSIRLPTPRHAARD